MSYNMRQFRISQIILHSAVQNLAQLSQGEYIVLLFIVYQCGDFHSRTRQHATCKYEEQEAKMSSS